MNDIHVAAGLPPGHSEAGCRCRPLMSQSLLDGGNIVIHRIAAPELLRPEQEASHAIVHTGTRIHGNREAEGEARGVRAPRRLNLGPCRAEGCGHAWGYHWGTVATQGGRLPTGDGYCTFPGTSVDHCERFVPRCANCPHGEDRHIVRTTGGRPRRCTYAIDGTLNNLCACPGFAQGASSAEGEVPGVEAGDGSDRAVAGG